MSEKVKELMKWAGDAGSGLTDLVRFAAFTIADRDAEIEGLKAENERLREEIRQSSIDHTKAEVERLKAERDEAVRAEREACAKVCEALGNDALIDEMEYRVLRKADEAIRARGDKT